MAERHPDPDEPKTTRVAARDEPESTRRVARDEPIAHLQPAGPRPDERAAADMPPGPGAGNPTGPVPPPPPGPPAPTEPEPLAGTHTVHSHTPADEEMDLRKGVTTSMPQHPGDHAGTIVITDHQRMRDHRYYVTHAILRDVFEALHTKVRAGNWPLD